MSSTPKSTKKHSSKSTNPAQPERLASPTSAPLPSTDSPKRKRKHHDSVQDAGAAENVAEVKDAEEDDGGPFDGMSKADKGKAKKRRKEEQRALVSERDRAPTTTADV
jgi:hypothetical protein